MSRLAWPDLLTRLVEGHELTAEESGWAIDQVLSGLATSAQVAGLAVGLRAKGETVEELGGMAAAMVDHAVPVDVDRDAVDIVGTGGDRANTVNVSTMASIVAAAAGAKVVKHGNRAASSLCGTADCFEALGARIDVGAEGQPGVLAASGLAFLFAPVFHGSLRHAAAARKELGIRTAFNYLGPLTNPARPMAQAIGCADARVAGLMAGVLAARGCRGLVFHGDDGLDELTTTTTSTVWLIGDGRVLTTELDPAQLGLQPARSEDLVGGDPAHNAGVVREVLAGTTGPVRDIVLANAAAALLAWRGVDLGAPLAAQMAGCLDDVARAIDDGRAQRTLDAFVAATNAA